MERTPENFNPVNDVETIVETIDVQSIDDLVEAGKIEIEKSEKIAENSPKNSTKRRRGRPKKEDIEAKKREQARQYLEGLNLIIPEGYKLTEQEITALVETGADKILKWLGGMGNSDAAFWMVVYGILDSRLGLTAKLMKIVKNRIEK